MILCPFEEEGKRGRKPERADEPEVALRPVPGERRKAIVVANFSEAIIGGRRAALAKGISCHAKRF